MKTKLLLVSCCLLCSIRVFTQNSNTTDYALRINALFQKIKQDTNYTENRAALNDSICMVMMKTLKQNEANVFSLPFDSVRNIGKVVSADKAICLYSWVVPLRERNIYNVVFQRADGYSFLLRKTVGKEPVDEYKIYDNSWYGALYYSITPFKSRGVTFYALLGSRSVGDFNQKIIDVLNFSEEEPILGLPVFVKTSYDEYSKRRQTTVKSRTVFEFDKRVSMYLEHDKAKKQFEFDNLSPMEVVDGKVLSYGPDFSFNAYRLKGGRWVFVEDINVKGK